MSDKTAPIKPFVRNATGLVREIGPWGSFVVPWLNMAGAGITFFSVQVVYLYPNGYVPLTFLLLAGPNILMAVIIALLAASVPRSAGGYVWVTRYVDPIFGWFSAGWLYWICFLFANGLLGGVMSTLMVTIFAVMGTATHTQAFLSFSNFLATPSAFITLTFTILILVGLASMLEIKYFMRIMYVSWAIGLVGLIVSIALFLTNSPATAALHFDSVWGAGAYNNIITLAAKYNAAGYIAKTSNGFWGDTLGMVGLVFFTVAGYETLAYAGGEVANPKSSFLTWYLAGMISTAVWYVILVWAVFNTYGSFIFNYNYVWNLYSAGSLSAADAASVSSYMFSPNMALFASSLTTVPILQILASFWFWPLTSTFPQYLTCNRTVFGLSFERMFPEKFSQVSERTHTPVYASLLNIVLMCLCAGLAFSVYGYLVSAANTSFFTALYYFAFALAAIALPYKRPEIWEKGLAKKIFGLPEMTVLGAICAALMVWVMGLSAIGVNEQAWNVTEVWILIGFLVLVYYIWKNRKMGINFMDIYKEIPPP